MIQQKPTKTKTTMILITKTLVIFPLFYTLARRLRPTSAALVIRPIQSHADIHTRSFVWWQCYRILASERTVKHLLSSDVDCSRFGFCSVVASIFGLQCFDAVGWAAGRASSL